MIRWETKFRENAGHYMDVALYCKTHREKELWLYRLEFTDGNIVFDLKGFSK